MFGHGRQSCAIQETVELFAEHATRAKSALIGGSVMREPNYVDRARLSPARTFKSPMDVVAANDIEPADKLAILKGWEADERALLRAEDEGMGGGEHSHLHKVHAALDHLRLTTF